MKRKFNISVVLTLLTVIMIGCGKSPEPPTIVVEKNDETFSSANVKPILDEWQQKTLRYFTVGASTSTGLAFEGNDRGDVVTIGGSGFGVMALIVGAERGWITRQEAVAQTQKIVRFLGKAERFNGAWAHWYTPDGFSYPFGNQVKTGDLIETSFMMAGLLAAKQYYTASSDTEKEIRDSVNAFWNKINWKFYTNNENVLKWLWYSQTNQFGLDIRGWNEGLVAYILALGAPSPHNIDVAVYNDGWKSNGSMYSLNRENYDYKLPMGENLGGSLFFAHYSFLGLDPREMADDKVNFWEQNVSHTMINRHYCVYEANGAYKYNEKNWGLTACYGAKPPLWNYLARSPLNDDGVIAPTAALSSYPYTPFYSTQVLMNLAQMPLAQGTYGFADSYCPSTNTSEKKHLAIDQGPIVVMIENYRSGLIWKLLMKDESVKKGLQLAGINKPVYKQGFIRTTLNTYTKEYDMMRHTDRGAYEISYYAASGGTSRLLLKDADNKSVMDSTQTTIAGENTFTFDKKSILKGKPYVLTLKTPDNAEFSLKVRLR